LECLPSTGCAHQRRLCAGAADCGAVAGFFHRGAATLSVEKPAPVQQFAEMIHEFIGGQADQIIGHGYERFQAVVTVVFLFILSCNLIGLIPRESTLRPSSDRALALAIATFVYYNFHGFRSQGFKGYMKHFAGPVWWLRLAAVPD
jgi:F-type H+-transporting ATPase subunit a